MISRTSKYLAAALVVGCASAGHAGTASVSPALAACSKALVETLGDTEKLPAYTIKAPTSFVSASTDPNAFTVVAHSAKTRSLLAKASCKATPTGEIVSFKSIPLKG